MTRRQAGRRVLGRGSRVPCLLALALVWVATGPASGRPRAGHAWLEPEEATIARMERWVAHARRLGLEGVLLDPRVEGEPGTVPEAHQVATGRVLAVRAEPPPRGGIEPPSLDRVTFHKPFRARGPDQVPLPGQYFLEEWVKAGGSAVSGFRTGDLYRFVADVPVPIGDVLFALAFVCGSGERGLWQTAGVLHTARLRGGRRQRLGDDFRAGFASGLTRVVPDRRPAFEILAGDAAVGRFDLVVDEPLAEATLWAGGKAPAGAFCAAVIHALPATASRLGMVVGIAADRAEPPALTPVGVPGSPWSRIGWARADELLPPGVAARAPRRLWVRLVAARRDHVRPVAAWVARVAG